MLELVILFDVAEDKSLERAAAGVIVFCKPTSRAKTPAASGAELEDPLVKAEREPGYVDRMVSPGAKMATLEP